MMDPNKNTFRGGWLTSSGPRQLSDGVGTRWQREVAVWKCKEFRTQMSFDVLFIDYGSTSIFWIIWKSFTQNKSKKTPDSQFPNALFKIHTAVKYNTFLVLNALPKVTSYRWIIYSYRHKYASPRKAPLHALCFTGFGFMICYQTLRWLFYKCQLLRIKLLKYAA